MTTSEPTTGEIVRALRCIADDTECKDCRYKYPVGNVILCDHEQMNENAADRLEIQEGAIKAYQWSACQADKTIQSMGRDIAALTARAEQAEAREKAAVNNAVRAVFYDTSNGKRGLLVDAGICEYCQSNGERTNCASCYENGNFKLRNNLRGLPQDGEGK